jgi:hypothetical protein
MRIHGAKHGDMENVLSEWLHGSMILQWMVVEQKRRLMKLHWKWALNVNVPMNGWNITWQAMSGESITADSNSAGKWRENVTPIITRYVPKDIFNVEKTAALHFSTKEVTDFKGTKLPGNKRV